MSQLAIALLGKRDEPTDAVTEYCRYLAAALQVSRDSAGNSPRTLGNPRLDGGTSCAEGSGHPVARHVGSGPIHGAGLVSTGLPTKSAPRPEHSEVRRRPRGHRLSRRRALPRHPRDRFAPPFRPGPHDAPSTRPCRSRHLHGPTRKIVLAAWRAASCGLHSRWPEPSHPS